MGFCAIGEIRAICVVFEDNSPDRGATLVSPTPRVSVVVVIMFMFGIFILGPKDADVRRRPST